MLNNFNLKNNPAQVDLFENSTLRKYLSLSSILYFICGILGITGISLFYGYISSIFGFYTQANFGIALTLSLGCVAFELNKTRKLPTLNYSIIDSTFSLLLVTIFSTISNFRPTLLDSNSPTTPLIFLAIAILGLIFCFAVQKSQVLFMQAMISLNIGFFGFLAYLVANYRSNILAVIGTDERLTLAIFVFANLVFLFQGFLFENYDFLMNKGYKVISHIGSYLSLGFFFTSSLISINSLTSTIFGSEAY
jgi:hypothetical protein